MTRSRESAAEVRAGVADEGAISAGMRAVRAAGAREFERAEAKAKAVFGSGLG